MARLRSDVFGRTLLQRLHEGCSVIPFYRYTDTSHRLIPRILWQSLIHPKIAGEERLQLVKAV
jgi:hypothetical protein